MSSPNGVGSDAPPTSATPEIQRLLFVSDAAVADVDALPPAVRAIIDAATEVNVLTPALPPGRAGGGGRGGGAGWGGCCPRAPARGRPARTWGAGGGGGGGGAGV